MNLLYLHQHFTTPQGSSGTRSYEMAVRMVEKGHRVTVLCGSFGAGNTGLSGEFSGGIRSGIVDGIEIIELELPYHNKDGFIKRAITFARFAMRTIRVISKIDRPNLIYATSTPLTVAIPTLWAKWIKKIPYVFEVRDLWPELPVAMGVIKNPFLVMSLKTLERKAYRNALACVGLSPGMVDGIKRELTHDKPVELIPNGCDIELFAPARALAKEKRTNNSVYALLPKVDNVRCNFVFAGTLGIANGLDALLQALSVIPLKTRKCLSVHLIGDGNQKERLQSLVAELGLDDSVVFHPPMQKKLLSHVIGLFDAGVLTLQDIPEFQYGTSPNKFFDYIAAGLPVLNNYPGWVAEMIENEKCGYYCEAGDPHKFADIITQFVNLSVEQKASMSENAVELSKKFDRQLLAERQIALCESLNF